MTTLLLTPFAVALFLRLRSQGMPLNYISELITTKVFPYFPMWLQKPLGICELCTSFWIGVILCVIFQGFNLSIYEILVWLAYNAISTVIILKQLEK